jgi:polyferredoxin
MLVLFFVTIIVAGPAWCSYLCYIGALDDRFSRSKGIPAAARLPKWAAHLRLLVFFLVIAIAAVFRRMQASLAVVTATAGIFVLAGIIMMTRFSRKHGLMIHCTAFCPIGLIGNLAGRMSLFRIQIAKNCCQCGKCSRSCRYGALQPENIARHAPGINCTLCGDCLTACPSASIGYSLPGLSADMARRFFLVIIISLHAVFVAVARI